MNRFEKIKCRKGIGKLKVCARTSQGNGEGRALSERVASLRQRLSSRFSEVCLKPKSAGNRGPVVVVKPRPRCAHPDCTDSGMVRCPIHLDLRCPVHFHKHTMSCRVASSAPPAGAKT